MKNIYVLYYDGFCEFEVVIALEQFREENIIAVSLEDRIYVSEERQKYVADKQIKDVHPAEVDLLLIPGGDPSPIYENEEVKQFIHALHERKTWIAGICGGAFLMASYGILDGRKCTGAGEGLKPGTKYAHLFERAQIVYEDVVVDGHLVTSTGKAYVELAFELVRLINEGAVEEAAEGYEWYKNTLPVYTP